MARIWTLLPALCRTDSIPNKLHEDSLNSETNLCMVSEIRVVPMVLADHSIFIRDAALLLGIIVRINNGLWACLKSLETLGMVSSPSRTWTYNIAVNRRALYHWAIGKNMQSVYFWSIDHIRAGYRVCHPLGRYHFPCLIETFLRYSRR